jgi:hypothetical protein
MPVFTPEQETYVCERQLCVLGTGKRDGSPQLSMVTYMFDGTYLLSSITKDRAKFANIRRQPRVAVLIPDGRRQLIVYGTARYWRARSGTRRSSRSAPTRVTRSPQATTWIDSRGAWTNSSASSSASPRSVPSRTIEARVRHSAFTDLGREVCRC